MNFDPAWETVHAERPWEIVPNEEMKTIVHFLYGDEPDRSKVSILDLGCGTGASALWLVQQGYSVFAVDASESALVRLSRHAEESGINRLHLKIGAADISDTDFGTEQFDCILDVYSIECLTDQQARQTIARTKDWLKPGGIIVSMMAAGMWEIPSDVMNGVPPPRLVDSVEWIREAFDGYHWSCGKRLLKLMSGKGEYHAWLVVGEKPGGFNEGKRAVEAACVHYPKLEAASA